MLGLAIPVLTTTFVERIVPVGLQAFTVSLWTSRLLAFAAALSIATGALFSLGPALQSAHASTAEVLQQHARGNAGGRSRMLRDGLVVLQVAATLVLLVAAGLMLRTLANLNAVELGFVADNLLTMQVALPVPNYAEPIKRQAFYERVIADVRALPGVRGQHSAQRCRFRPPATRDPSLSRVVSPFLETPPDALFRVGTADYLQTLRVVPVEGRLLDARDGADAPPAVVVNETLARQFMPGQSALGRRIRFGSTDQPWFTVVGVVKDVLERGYEQGLSPVSTWRRYRSRPASAPGLIVRVDGDPLGYSPAVQSSFVQSIPTSRPA